VRHVIFPFICMRACRRSLGVKAPRLSRSDIVPPSLSSRPLYTMSSSYGTDIFTQTTQFHPVTFQPGPTGPYRNPNSAPSNFIEPPPPSQPQPASRPHSIAELAEIARQSLGDGARPFKTWLRIAENARRDAKSFLDQGNLESAFVEYAKAATIVLEKIPSHPEYRVLLSTTQRHNMGLVSYFLPLVPMSAVRLVVYLPYECIDECIFRGCTWNAILFWILVILSTLIRSFPSKRQSRLAG
jgi:hypothetical protein